MTYDQLFVTCHGIVLRNELCFFFVLRNRRSLPFQLTTRGYQADAGENYDHAPSLNRSFPNANRDRDREVRLRRQDTFSNSRNEEEPMEKRRRSETFDVVVHRTTPIVIGPRSKPTYDSEEEDFSQDLRGRIQDRGPPRVRSQGFVWRI